jgi:hypothetical protein
MLSIPGRKRPQRSRLTYFPQSHLHLYKTLFRFFIDLGSGIIFSIFNFPILFPDKSLGYTFLPKIHPHESGIPRLFRKAVILSERIIVSLPQEHLQR